MSSNRRSESMNKKKTNPVTCFSCGKFGHISISCPKQEKRASARLEKRNINLCSKQALPKGQLTLTNGKIIPFIFDSDSDCSLVKESI